MKEKLLQPLPALPWYDSFWLVSFLRVRDYLEQHAPARLPEFLAVLEPLRTDPGFAIREIPDLFDTHTHEQLKTLVRNLKPEHAKKHELLKFGRLVIHDDPLVSSLHKAMTKRVCEWVGEEVEPSYNFLSLYNNLGVCAPHMDAPSAKWTVDYCIDQSAPWPIHFSQVQEWPVHWQEYQAQDWPRLILEEGSNDFSTYVLEPGQALVFAGSNQWHYRERITQLQQQIKQQIKQQNFCYLAFFHFVPKGQQQLANPGNWPALFGIPELQTLVIPEP